MSPRTHSHRIACVALALLAMATMFMSLPLSSARSAEASIERRHDVFFELVEAHNTSPYSDFSRFVADKYQEGFAAAVRGLGKKPVNVRDLEWLFRAARAACFYTGQATHADDMQKVLDQLAVKKSATEVHYSQMLDAYVKTRWFDKAEEIYRLHGNRSMAVLPKFGVMAIEAGNAPTELIVARDQRLLSRQIAPLPISPYVLVVSHPLCHFSQNAAAAIAQDAALSALFRDHAKWLAPVDLQLNFDVLQQWNRDHQDGQISIAYRSEEWPLIDSWATPTFYFIDGGNVKAKVEGWPKEGRVEELLDAARTMGLLSGQP